MFCNSDSGILSHIDINTNYFMENMRGLQANPGLPIRNKLFVGTILIKNGTISMKVGTIAVR